MSKTIVQKIVFQKTKPKALYDLYMNAKKHSIATGAPAVIVDEPGTKYTTHGGYISGENLLLTKNKTIVQTWRGMDWDKKDPDSIFIISLIADGEDTILHATHANIPAKHAPAITKGWHAHYWKPWKKYLAGKPIAKSPSM
jgi:activator of HSP90 ATPase